FPWTTTGGEPLLAKLRQVVDDEAAAVTALGRHLARLRVPMPILGAYPASFTSYNFVALDYLLPRLVEAQKKSIAELEADCHRLGHEESRVRVQELLAVKKTNLAALEALAAAQPAGV